MKIIKHKSINMDVSSILESVHTNSTPHGVAINITDRDTIVVEPDGVANLFGELDSDYEMIYYNDEE